MRVEQVDARVNRARNDCNRFFNMVDARVSRAKVEIIADMFVGTVESGAITGFADLHDYVDANGYGGMLDGDPELEALLPEQFAAFTNEVQTAIDVWIQSDEFKRIDRLIA